MLSILIPVYNFNVVPFVKELQSQAKKCQIHFEIICLDDCSSSEFRIQNSELGEIPHVIYEELPENIGRSKIRNRMARKAKHEYLLFLDSDSKTNDNAFIQRYVDHVSSDKVIYGGRNYEKNPPKDLKKYFRWWYGINRETISAIEREKQPYQSFMTNNFMLPKQLFTAIGLDETISGYGHEDTLFGVELKKKKIPIIHIENPLCHIGLEEADEFLEKTKEGIRNLNQLILTKKIDDSVKLYRFYKKVKIFKLDDKILRYYQKNQQKIVSKLKKERPNLRWFDLFKLGYLIELNKE